MLLTEGGNPHIVLLDRPPKPPKFSSDLAKKFRRRFIYVQQF